MLFSPVFTQIFEQPEKYLLLLDYHLEIRKGGVTLHSKKKPLRQLKLNQSGSIRTRTRTNASSSSFISLQEKLKQEIHIYALNVPPDRQRNFNRLADDPVPPLKKERKFFLRKGRG